MINNFSPPTDNLYKFIAISGLVLVVLSITLAVTSLDTQIEAAEAALLEYHEAWIACEGIEEARRKLDESMRMVGEGKSPFGLTLQIKDIESVPPSTLSLVRKFEIVAVQSSHQIDLAKYAFKGLGLVLALGLIMMAHGFWRWKTRLQKFQDKIIKLEAQRLENEVRPPRKRATLS